MKPQVLTVLVLALGAGGLRAQTLTCDPQQIDARSYRLTTQAQALIVTDPRYAWWDTLAPGNYSDEVFDMNLASMRAAEKALELDPRNRMAHALLARQYLLLEQREAAEAAWARVLDAGGAVAWTATLYDVDARSYFVLVFDRRGLRIHSFEQTAGRVARGSYGIPQFPGPQQARFWAAMGGCFDTGLRPQAEVPWSDVREIKAGNWVLWFGLRNPIELRSDRTAKRISLRELQLNLHGRSGDLEVSKPVASNQPAFRGRGPAAFQDLVRRTLAASVDPGKHIALPPARPDIGW